MRALKAFARAALVLAFAAPLSAATDTWQDLPESLQLEPVGDRLSMNGTPMAIRAFRSQQAAEALLREVQAGWERDPAHQRVQRTSIPNWIVLNQTIGGHHRSIQVRERGGATEGFVAVTSPLETREPTLALRLPPLVLPMQVVDSVNHGKVSQQVVAVSRRSVNATAVAIGDALRSQRWEHQVMKKQGAVVRLSANRGAEQFDAILSGQNHGALVMINTVR